VLRPCGWNCRGRSAPDSWLLLFRLRWFVPRAVGEIFQQLVHFGHDLQRHLRRGQALVCQLQFPFEPGDLDLLRGALANLLSGLLALEHAGIAELSPFGDLGRIDALLTQIRPSFACGSRNIASGKMDKFLGRSNRTPSRRTTRPWLLGDVVVHRTIVVHDAYRWVRHGESVPSSRSAIRRTCY